MKIKIAYQPLLLIQKFDICSFKKFKQKKTKHLTKKLVSKKAAIIFKKVI